MPLDRLILTLRGRGLQFGVVVDEYGEVQGVISVRDVLEAIAGEFNAPGDGDAWAVQREDGSWLVDGLIPVPELKDRLALKDLPEEDRGRYNTLAGMIMLLLGRLPRTADAVEWEDWRFEVVDLGINTDADKFIAALEEHQPDILGMSALLTTTMPYMKVVVDTMKERGLRDKYIILVGGAPLNEEFGVAVGADAYCRDAAVAAETAKQLVSARRTRTAEPPGPSVA